MDFIRRKRVLSAVARSLVMATMATALVAPTPEAPTDPWPVPGPDNEQRIFGVPPQHAQMSIPRFYANGAFRFVFLGSPGTVKWDVGSMKFRSGTDTTIMLGSRYADGSLMVAATGSKGVDIGGQPDYGTRGADGGRGGDGQPGRDAVDLELAIGTVVMPARGSTSRLLIEAQGGTGGVGGDGGQGQLGGGSQCGKPFANTRFDGGDGGNGGNGGNGGRGGRAARVLVLASIDGGEFQALDLNSTQLTDVRTMTLTNDGGETKVQIVVSGLRGGIGGAGGRGGSGAPGGDQGMTRDCGFLRQDAHGGHPGRRGLDGIGGAPGGGKSS